MTSTQDAAADADRSAKPKRSRRERKSIRRRLCEGFEAAIKAEPKAFATTKPKTMLGCIVRELVCEAARGRCDAIKLVVAFLDEAERGRSETESRTDDSQGISDTIWDWSEDGVWDSSEREPAGETRDLLGPSSAERLELQRSIQRVIEAEELAEFRKKRKSRAAPPEEHAPPN